jgi:serine/threonine protein kinase
LDKEVFAFEHLLCAGVCDGVVPFLGIGKMGGRKGIVMPFLCPVRTVKERLRSPGFLLRFTRQLLSTVSRLNDSGLMHGDIKPNNVLLSAGADRSTVYVCDFGLAQWGEAVCDKSMRNSGTFPYRIGSWFTERQQTAMVNRQRGFRSTDRFAAMLTVLSAHTGFELCAVSRDPAFDRAATRRIGTMYFNHHDDETFVHWLFVHHESDCNSLLHPRCCSVFQKAYDGHKEGVFELLDAFMKACA